METQNQLIESCLSLPYYLARRLANRTRPALYEELAGAGNLGLVLAAKKYDPARGTKFSTFAYRVIGWAMTDYLRSIDLLTQDERKAGDTWERRQVGIEKARHVTEAERGYQEAEDNEDVAGFLRRLTTEKEKYVVRELFWGDREQVELARELRITRARVGQILKVALRKMRATV